MKRTPEQPDDIERELARRFRHLRREESLTTPPCPAGLDAPRPVPVATAGRGGAVGVAAALAAVIVVAFVAVPRPQSPDELYRDIMNTNELLTDGLLDVSPAALPEYTRAPRLYDLRTAGGASH